MADKSYLSAQPGFLNARGRAPPPQRNMFARFWQDEIAAPEKRAGNLAVARGVAVFAAGIIFVRTLGAEMIVPVF